MTVGRRRVRPDSARLMTKLHKADRKVKPGDVVTPKDLASGRVLDCRMCGLPFWRLARRKTCSAACSEMWNATHGQRIAGGLTTKLTPDRFVAPAGRVCAEDDCGTILSRYNPTDYCSIHGERRELRYKPGLATGGLDHAILADRKLHGVELPPVPEDFGLVD